MIRDTGGYYGTDGQFPLPLMEPDNGDVGTRIEALRESLTKDFREEDHKLELQLKDVEKSITTVTSQLQRVNDQLTTVKWVFGIFLAVASLTLALVGLIAANVI